MEPFDEFVSNSTQFSCLQKYSSKLIDMGASWDSFRREEQDIVKDLTDSGIPILAARDIVDIASAQLKRSTAPMAVFWDLENMPIPASMSGREVTSRLKTILEPHGEMVQFRGYASIGLGHIPEEKRSDLHLAHCHLVDCPHVGRKDVADKMIIVDAMNFAYQHPDGATLCFITGDIDYAYLLASLQQNRQWKTIVISTKMQTMLQVNCDMMMRWETDIIHEKADSGTSEGGFSEWNDDVEFLLDVVKREPLKSRVGSILRETNPARFPDRESVKSFFVAAIESGVVVETGFGPFKMLNLPGSQTAVSMEVSKMPPLALDDIPERVIEMTLVMPYIIFAKWKYCPPGNNFPKRIFVQSFREWAIAMFHSKNDVQSAVRAAPWLRHGILVDWNQLTDESRKCSLCLNQSDTLIEMQDGKQFCSDCRNWAQLPADAKQAAVACTIEAMDYLADNDDIIVVRGVLRTLLCLRNPDKCPSKTVSDRWIDEVLQSNAVKVHELKDGRTYLFLERRLGLSRPEITREMEAVYSTSNEEQFVQDLLWDADSVVTRKAIISKLVGHFESMQNVFTRRAVFHNGFKSGKFALSKGRANQVVGLTKEDADASLALIEGKIEDGMNTDVSSSRKPLVENVDLDGGHSMNSGVTSTSSDSDGSSGTQNDETPIVSTENHNECSQSNKTAKPVPCSTLLDSNGKFATRNLYIHGYGSGTTPSVLKNAFMPYSRFVDVVMKQGYCFVNMAKRDDAVNARQRLNGTLMCGGQIVINFAKE